MNTSKLFTIESNLNKKDYRHFLYISTFFKDKFAIFKMILLLFSSSIFCIYSEGSFSLKSFFIIFILLSFIFISLILIRIESRINKRIKTDATGIFNTQETLDFYNDFIVVNNSVFEGEIKIKYNQIYKAFESNHYFITYFNINQATLINKTNLDTDTINNLRNLYKDNLKDKYINLKI